jgi:hypothetical protein
VLLKKKDIVINVGSYVMAEMSNIKKGSKAQWWVYMMSNDKQVKGDHYKSMTMQPWDFIIENQLPFCEGNIIKYICRYKNKGGIDDLEKAKHYLEKLIEIEGRKNCTW